MRNAPKICNAVIAMAMLVAMALSMAGCNAQKKNTAAARRYTAFITKYNIQYNGDKHYRETLQEMEDKYEDDYTRMLFMHPVEAKNDKKAPQPSGDFKRSIEKAQKAIQVRSIKKKPERKSGKGNDPKYKEWMKRDEYNPVMQDSWMLLGRSQYYNGDFLGAASTFYYISKHFTWLPATVVDAKLWQARSYLALDWLYEAELLITRIKPDELTNRELEYQYNFTYADYLIRRQEYAKAVPYLTQAIKYSSGAQTNRMRFLLGQVYMQLDDRANAYAAFSKVASSNSALYRTKLNARIKQSEVFNGNDIESEVKSLRAMTRYDRNKDYLDQIYYAIGNLYLSRGDTLQAIKNYEQAVEKSTRGGIEKAIAQITLGELYYLQGNYEKAQPCYSEAVPLLPETHRNYRLLKSRSDVLDELAVYSQNVNLQDSLLHLASLPEDQLLAVIDKIIKDLKEREKKEAEQQMRDQYQAQNAGRPGLQDNNQREFNINTDDSWYFYNTTTRNAGKTDFQKRWGARKLEDDWRRRNKATFNMADFDAADSDDNAEGASDTAETPTDSVAAPDAAVDEAANDPHKREYYLKQIPSTEEEKENSHQVIQEGLYNMGVILKDKLDDTAGAQREFARLLRDYPDNQYRLDTYYNLYLMYMRRGDTAEAEKYRQLILADFADSQYGQALSDPHYIDKLRQMQQVEGQLYDRAFEAYMDNDNAEVHSLCRRMQEDYPLSKLMPRFMFLDALAYVTDKQPEQFNAVLRDMLERYPGTHLAPYASAWLKGMAQGKTLQTSGDGKNMRGMLWDIHLGNDSTSVANDSVARFVLDPNAPQLLVLVYPTDEISGNALLYEVARHNFGSFTVKDFDLEPMRFGRLGMLVIKGFANQKQLDHYRTVMARSEDFRLPSGVEPIAISEANFDILLKQGRTFDDYFRFLDEQNYIDPQKGLLQPDQIETLEEREESEAGNPKAAPQPAETPQPPTGAASDTPKAPTGGAPQPTKPGANTKKATPKPQAPTLPAGSEGDDDPLLQ